MTTSKQGGRREKRTQAGERKEGAPTPTVPRFGGVPLDRLVTAVRGPVHLELDEPANAEFQRAEFRIDGGPWTSLDRGERRFGADLSTRGLPDGPHTIELRVKKADGTLQVMRGHFRVRSRAL